MELRLRLTWIRSESLGTNSGQGETGIGVLVQCYTECNSPGPRLYKVSPCQSFINSW